ncbi:unnamed protein product, partial [Pylaiella littoralis]
AVDSKELVSDHFRLVFLAGLEGAGHHYFMAADRHMFDNNPDLPRIWEEHNIDLNPYYLPSFMGGKACRYAEKENQARAEMRKLANAAASMPSPGTIYVEHHEQAWSYPTGHGVHKAMQYLDLQRMAETAADEGVDFRVLYLQRSAGDIIIANTVHRRFQNYLNDPHEGTPEERFLEYMRVLFTDIAVLHSFLLELSPGHVICHDWDVLGDEEQATRIADFISPNEFVAGCVKSSLMRTARHRPANVIPLPFDGGDAIVARLQRKLDAFEEVLCGPKRSA